MILNLYVEVVNEQHREEIIALLQKNAMVFDATEFDSYTSGSCALDSLEEIERDIRDV